VSAANSANAAKPLWIRLIDSRPHRR
jgi:hypothetical protein